MLQGWQEHRALRNRAGTGHPGKPLVHLLPQHELLWSPRGRFSSLDFKAVTPAMSCVCPQPPAHCTRALLPVWGHGPEWLLSEDTVPPAYRATAEATGGGVTAHIPPHAPGCSTKQVFLQGEQRQGPAKTWHLQSRKHQDFTDSRREGQDQWGQTESLWAPSCVPMRSWHSSAPTPFPFSLLLHCTQGRGQVWGGAAGGKDTPAPCRKNACPRSPASSGVTTALSWAVSPAVAGLMAPCHGSGHRGALLGPARFWHHVLVVLVVMVAPEPSSPPDMVSLARQELGPCPWAGGTGEQRCCETLDCGSHPIPTAGHA